MCENTVKGQLVDENGLGEWEPEGVGEGDRSKPKRLTVKTVAWELGVSEKHVRALVRAGKLEGWDIKVEEATGLPRGLRITRRSVEKFLEERRISG